MTRVTRNFQISIPKRIREKYGVKVGDEVKFVDRGSEIVLLIKLPEEEPLEAGVLDGAYEKIVRKEEHNNRRDCSPPSGELGGVRLALDADVNYPRMNPFPCIVRTKEK